VPPNTSIPLEGNHDKYLPTSYVLHTCIYGISGIIGSKFLEISRHEIINRNDKFVFDKSETILRTKYRIHKNVFPIHRFRFWYPLSEQVVFDRIPLLGTCPD